MKIANPIYDVVFKYLLEDNESAKLLLGEILQEEIVELKALPQEISLRTKHKTGPQELSTAIQDERDKDEFAEKDKLDVYLQRMDFMANIKTQDGRLKKVLIEIQKAKYIAQIHRFRRYLGSAYLQQDDDRQYRPIVAIYFLGEILKSVPAAVLGIENKYTDRTNSKQTETKLLGEEEFIELLTHEGIIVQIPRLCSEHQSKIEEFLAVFDQSKIVHGNPHFLEFDPATYPEKYRPIVRRLEHAVCKEDIQRKMELEDEAEEVFAKKDKELEEKDKELEEKDKELEEKDKELEAQRKLSKQKDQALAAAKEIAQKKEGALMKCVLALHRLGTDKEKIMKETGLAHAEVQAIIEQG